MLQPTFSLATTVGIVLFSVFVLPFGAENLVPGSLQLRLGLGQTTLGHTAFGLTFSVTVIVAALTSVLSLVLATSAALALSQVAWVLLKTRGAPLATVDAARGNLIEAGALMVSNPLSPASLIAISSFLILAANTLVHMFFQNMVVSTTVWNPDPSPVTVVDLNASMLLASTLQVSSAGVFDGFGPATATAALLGISHVAGACNLTAAGSDSGVCGSATVNSTGSLVSCGAEFVDCQYNYSAPVDFDVACVIVQTVDNSDTPWLKSSVTPLVSPWTKFQWTLRRIGQDPNTNITHSVTCDITAAQAWRLDTRNQGTVQKIVNGPLPPGMADQKPSPSSVTSMTMGFLQLALTTYLQGNCTGQYFRVDEPFMCGGRLLPALTWSADGTRILNKPLLMQQEMIYTIENLYKQFLLSGAYGGTTQRITRTLINSTLVAAEFVSPAPFWGLFGTLGAVAVACCAISLYLQVRHACPARVVTAEMILNAAIGEAPRSARGVLEKPPVAYLVPVMLGPASAAAARAEYLRLTLEKGEWERGKYLVSEEHGDTDGRRLADGAGTVGVSYSTFAAADGATR
ncbi:hypothetical protein BC830DRAFT_1090015 [Chytriomyces sp. MP71]|nr:hypothetical protein BC830DRAFT_1090015 [Chytriomyces sp. MP71]